MMGTINDKTNNYCVRGAFVVVVVVVYACGCSYAVFTRAEQVYGHVVDLPV